MKLMKKLPLLLFALHAALAFAQPHKVAQNMVVVVPEGDARPVTLAAQVEDFRHALGQENVLWVDSQPRTDGKPSGFASMAVLNFPGAVQLNNPAALAAPLQLSVVDILTQGGSAPPAGSNPVYKISYYQLTAPRANLQAWVDGYLSKYLEAQQRHGILTRYAMYLERGHNGRALLVLEYPDANTEQTAEPIKGRLNDEILRTDAEYARQLGLKETLRKTQSWTIAVPAQ